MKAIIVALSLLAAAFLIAAPASGAAPAAEPATPAAPALFLSGVDQVMISADEFSDWMAHHKTRLELRDTNHAVTEMCDRLQDAERRMSLIAGDPGLKPEDARRADIRRFDDQIVVVGKELTTMHAAVRRLAEAPPAAAGDSVPSVEREGWRARQADFVAELDRADKHGTEAHGWVIDKQAPRGLDEMSRDIDLSRQELRGMIGALGRLGTDPAITRDRIRDLTQVLDCARTLLTALNDAQDRVEGLAKSMSS